MSRRIQITVQQLNNDGYNEKTHCEKHPDDHVCYKIVQTMNYSIQYLGTVLSEDEVNEFICDNFTDIIVIQ